MYIWTLAVGYWSGAGRDNYCTLYPHPTSCNKISSRFEVGKEISSYDEILSAVHELVAEQCVTYTRDSRTIEAAKGRFRREINLALKYYKLKFTCIKGGQKHSGKSMGQRPIQRTFRDCCTSFVKAHASKNEKTLLITDINLQHNHETSKSFSVGNVPRQRHISDELADGVQVMFKTRSNKELLQDHIRMIDLSNYAAKLKPKQKNLEEILTNGNIRIPKF
uniref:ZSWIM3 N-terminal domain-containing protein n=1 Tax=Amphimedon queenslandica TaxID=400682 RepID=A0A1X7VR88_AMPQE